MWRVVIMAKNTNLKAKLSKEVLSELYYTQNKSASDIAGIYGCSKHSVLNLMKSYELPRRSKEEARLDKVSSAQKVLSKELLIEEYVVKNESLRNISIKYKILEPTIVKLMKKYNISSRGRSESLFLRHSHSPRVDEEFFQRKDSDFYYFLGLIASDGCIIGNSISLNLKDKDVIDYLAEVIQFRNEILVYKKGNSVSYTLKFENPRVADILRGYGIVERKSLILKFPEIPETYISDYIRGVFDGDGTAVLTKRLLKDGSYSSHVKVGFVSGSKDFIEGLERILIKHVGTNVKIQMDRRGNGTYMYYFNAKKNVQRFTEWIYGEDFNKFGMYRKKDRLLTSTSS